MKHFAGPTLAVVGLALITTVSSAMAVTPEERCEAGKNDAAGKFAGCMAKAQRALVLTGDVGRYDTAVVKCEEKESASFAKLETQAGAGICPSEGDALDIQDFVDSCMQAVAGALSGGTLPEDLADCYNDLGTCQVDLDTCNDGYGTCQDALTACEAQAPNALLRTGQTDCYDIDGFPISCSGTGQDGDVRAGGTRSYTNNGDGTVTDNATLLQWEKLSDDGSIHDKDNTYNWEAAYDKIAQLNLAGFAGHNDWRLPNVRELESLIDYDRPAPTVANNFNSGCVGACSVTACSCTKTVNHWTSTSYAIDPACAWVVSFGLGQTSAPLKTGVFAVRAVRGGL